MKSYAEIVSELAKIGVTISTDELSLSDIVYLRELFDDFLVELKDFFEKTVQERFYESFKDAEKDLNV